MCRLKCCLLCRAIINLGHPGHCISCGSSDETCYWRAVALAWTLHRQNYSLKQRALLDQVPINCRAKIQFIATLVYIYPWMLENDEDVWNLPFSKYN